MNIFSVADKHLSRIQEENERKKKMEEKYPIKEMRDRAAAAESWVCPDCGAPLVEVDGSLMHLVGAGKPARGCSREECSYICMV